MKCPACRGIVVVVEYERIELDYCTRCCGVWFDAGELELLVERLNLEGDNGWLRGIMSCSGEKVSEKSRRCPVCRRKMKKAHVGDHPPVLIDVCCEQDGIWFDGGEVTQLLGQMRAKGPLPGEDGRVINFLGEVFQARK